MTYICVCVHTCMIKQFTYSPKQKAQAGHFGSASGLGSLKRLSCLTPMHPV